MKRFIYTITLLALIANSSIVNSTEIQNNHSINNNKQSNSISSYLKSIVSYYLEDEKSMIKNAEKFYFTDPTKLPHEEIQKILITSLISHHQFIKAIKLAKNIQNRTGIYKNIYTLPAYLVLFAQKIKEDKYIHGFKILQKYQRQPKIITQKTNDYLNTLLMINTYSNNLKSNSSYHNFLQVFNKVQKEFQFKTKNIPFETINNFIAGLFNWHNKKYDTALKYFKIANNKINNTYNRISLIYYAALIKMGKVDEANKIWQNKKLKYYWDNIIRNEIQKNNPYIKIADDLTTILSHVFAILSEEAYKNDDISLFLDFAATGYFFQSNNILNQFTLFSALAYSEFPYKASNNRIIGFIESTPKTSTEMMAFFSTKKNILLASSGQKDKAKRNMLKNLKLYPNNYFVLITWARYLYSAKKIKEAESQYEKLRKFIQNNKNININKIFHYYYDLAIIKFDLGKKLEAEQEIKTIMKLKQSLSPKLYSNLLNILAYFWLERDYNYKKALEFAQQAHKIYSNNNEPMDTGILDTIGWAYYKLGQLEKAANYIEESLKYNTICAECADHLGDIYWAQGDKNNAMYQWREILNMDTSSAVKNLIKEKIKKYNLSK